MTWVLAAVCGLATIPAGLRWLRIAQREHYLAPSVTRFALRWWSVSPTNRLLLALGVVGVIGTIWSVWFGFLVAAAQIGPVWFDFERHQFSFGLDTKTGSGRSRGRIDRGVRLRGRRVRSESIHCRGCLVCTSFDR